MVCLATTEVNAMRELFLQALDGERTERPPVWLMRQAGRYLPEYRELRSEYSFLEAIKTPEIAEEISLQPYERFGVDAVVMYSDILTVLEPLGLSYHLESGVGPVIENPIESPAQCDGPIGDVHTEIDYVKTLLERLSERLEEQAAVVGFAGGPFTIASYAVAGEPTDDHLPLRRLRGQHPQAFQTLLDRITNVTVDYVRLQEAAGADAIQLFDTYAGVLPRHDYREFLLDNHRQIHDAVDIPTIMFARGMGSRLDQLAASNADAVSIDWTVSMDDARQELGEMPVQGNLDPAVLLSSPDHVREQTAMVIEEAGPIGHVLNLGHGVYRDTPVENVAAFVETATSWTR